MYKSAGVDKTNGQPLFYKDVTDADGNVTGQTTTSDITSATRYDLGDVNPDLYGGFGFNLTWTPSNAGQLDLGFQFSYQLGGKIYDGMYQQYMTVVGNAGQTLHKDVLKGWDPITNPNSNIPVLSSLAADVTPSPSSSCSAWLSATCVFTSLLRTSSSSVHVRVLTHVPIWVSVVTPVVLLLSVAVVILLCAPSQPVSS